MRREPPVDSGSVTASGPEEELVDHVADLVLRGEDPDVERLIAGRADVSAVTAAKLRKLASAFGPRKLAARADTALPFAQLGPYRILARLGEGGMGVVYTAEHQFLARRVALKVIRPELTLSAVTRGRFRREAVSISGLRHPNIVTVYDAGEIDGVAFMAMELVEGTGLDARLRSARDTGERLDAKTVARHARDVALALQCAHDAGIVHRDVKPSNVIVTQDGRALLLDFGLCLAEDAVALSGSGQFRGTPQYASPEQLETDAGSIDARTDVYSLGITMYECLTGRLPFDGAGLKRLLHQIVAEDPPAPRSLNVSIDADLNAIVMRAIAKRPEDRFQSAGEMARVLDGWLTASERATASPRARRTRSALFAGAVVVLALSGVAWRTMRAQTDDPAAAEPSRPVARVAAHSTTQLFGGPDQPFAARLEQWDILIGGGTFGADEDGTGVVGTSVNGISGRPRALTGDSGSVSGRIELVPIAPGATTRAAGIGVELTNGRVVALMLESTPRGCAPALFELVRNESLDLVRGARLDPAAVSAAIKGPVVLTLSWNGTDIQFDCHAVEAGSITDTHLVPRAVIGHARPGRFMLLVEDGSARFEDWVLEES
jgi:tRNA A-37 threonylcarbamoyl transferase component Bud32